MRKLILIGLLAVSIGFVACSPQSPADTTQTTNNTGDPAPNQSGVTVENQESTPSTNQSGDVQVVDVEAYQFGWDPNPIRVEAGRPVRLELSSRDVEHGIGIPELGVSQTIPASGETVTAEFTPEQTGEYNFICNVYCGRGHSSMTGTLIVE